MSKLIDGQSILLLRELRGALLTSVSGVRYTGLVGYSSVQLNFAAGRSLTVTLRSEVTAANEEAFVAELKATSAASARVGQDQMTIGDFRVARAYKLQRRESTEWSASDGVQYVGRNPREIAITAVGANDFVDGDVVDAGIALESDGGLVLELYADSFPLILQLRLTVAASSVPTPRRVLIE